MDSGSVHADEQSHVDRETSGVPWESVVLGTLAKASPDGVVAAVRVLLARYFGATGVRLLVADYQSTALHPVQDPDDRVVSGDSLPGRVFDLQYALTDEAPGGAAAVHLPVSARGDRMGVLELTTAAAPEPDRLQELQRVADTVAYALLAVAHQTDTIDRAARSRRLTLAAELQRQLLPGRSCCGPGYDIAGHIDRAYQVRASSFDWSHDQERVQISVTSAAPGQRDVLMLPTLAVTALRNARRAGLEPADQATLAGQAVFAQHLGHEHIDTLLMTLDPHTGSVAAVRAGSPWLFVLRDGQVLQARLTDQDPLGMFEDVEYDHEYFSLFTGDRVLLVAGGSNAVSPARDRSAVTSLTALLLSSREQPVTTVVQAMIDQGRRRHDVAVADAERAILLLDFTGTGTGTDTTDPSVGLRPISLLRPVHDDDVCAVSNRK